MSLSLLRLVRLDSTRGPPQNFEQPLRSNAVIPSYVSRFPAFSEVLSRPCPRSSVLTPHSLRDWRYLKVGGPL